MNIFNLYASAFFKCSIITRSNEFKYIHLFVFKNVHNMHNSIHWWCLFWGVMTSFLCYNVFHVTRNAFKWISLEFLITFIMFYIISDVPETRPTIHGIRSRYKPGEILRGNCTSKYSKPGANLTWTINDVLVSIHVNK